MNEFEKRLEAVLLSYGGDYPEKLYKAMRYALFPAGKRIRPRLVFLSSEFLGIPFDKVVPLALAIELIHNYSLIHDDLPCMDNDDFRRGLPSCHKKFGEAMALLAGDALLNLAYEILFEAVCRDASLVKSASFIATMAGIQGMIGGQALEFSFDTFNDDLITQLCMKKTGALIKAAVLSPAFLSEDYEKNAALAVYAESIGVAFQLQDDLIDEDKKETKSYLHVNGKERTVFMLNKLNETAKNALSKWDSAEQLINLSDSLTNRKS